MGSEPRTLRDVPRTAWAWVVLQIAATLVGVLFFPGSVGFRLLSIGFTTLLVVFFLRASRWVWWFAVVLSVVGIIPLVPGRSLILLIYDAAYGLASLCLLFTPSVRRHFFYRVEGSAS